MYASLDDAHRAGEDLFLNHCHHTANGNRIIAESLYKFIADQQL